MCIFFGQHRLELIGSTFHNNPSMLTFNALVSSQDSQVPGNVHLQWGFLNELFSH